MKTIAIIESCDTKYKEVAFMREFIEKENIGVIVINTATGTTPSYNYDISREEVLLESGVKWEEIEAKTKNEKMRHMTEATANLVEKLYKENKIHAVLSVGGLQNTIMATTAMQRLPIGFPKVMATTIASGQRKFESVVGDKDIVVIPSICDFTGLNIVTRQIIANASACCIGMVQHAGNVLEKGKKPVVAVSLMGITNNGACSAIEELERLGIEVIGFHTTGVGGTIMESMAEDRLVDGILDFTIHEITSGYFGGGFSYNKASEGRLSRSAAIQVPLVVCLGGLDFIDFATSEFPSRMDERVYMLHNDTTAHIKILPDEAREVAQIVIQRLANVDYHIRLLVPTDGMHHNSKENQELYCKEVDNILIDTISSHVNEHVEVTVIPGNMDEKQWGIQAAHRMLDELKYHNRISKDLVY